MRNLFLLCTYLISSFSFACSCSPSMTMEKALEEAHVVITGKIIAKEIFSNQDREITGLISSKVKYKIEVLSSLKGKIKSKKILTIVTSPGGAGDCGYKFEIGSTYIVYAYYQKERPKDKFLYTSICTRTKKFDQIEFNKIKRRSKYKGYS